MRAMFAVAAACVVLGLAGCGGASSGGGSGQTAPILPPVANAGGPYTGTAGTPVTFSGSGSSDPQGQGLTYAWNFGDGGTGTGSLASHTYAQVAGVPSSTYNVTLTVQNTSGSSAQASTRATIQGPALLSDTALTGTVSTGTANIIGAHVYLFAANTTGYGGAGIAASGTNASVSLLTATETGTSDSIGPYVLTDGNGNFSLTGLYTCTSGQQLYIYALGGNAGLGANSNSGLMAVVGACPTTSTAIVAKVNEVSTVAAAHAMAGFATDATHVSSSGTALAKIGVANAFANAANLVTLSTGVALATTPAGNGTVPQTLINNQANMLSTCINSLNNSPIACSTIFTNALAGGTTGTAPTETATAAINMAHNPAANVLFFYDPPQLAPPYSPAFSGPPNDFTLGIVYTAAYIQNPGTMAVDGNGNVWIADGILFTVTEISSSGVFLSGASGYHVGPDPSHPLGIAIDLSGNAWVADFGSNSVTEINGSGTFLSPAGGYTGGGLNNPERVAIDASGNAWVTNPTAGVTELSNTGAILSGSSGYTGGGMNFALGEAIDGSGNVWITNGNNSVTKLSSSGAPISGSSGYTGGGLNQSDAIAIDSSGSAWVANYGSNSVTKLSSSGAALSGTTGFTGGGLNSPNDIAIDGSGNAWIANIGSHTVVELSNSGNALLSGVSTYPANTGPYNITLDGSGDVWTVSNGAVVELIGASAPVVTPLAVGVKNNTVGARP